MTFHSPSDHSGRIVSGSFKRTPWDPRILLLDLFCQSPPSTAYSCFWMFPRKKKTNKERVLPLAFALWEPALDSFRPWRRQCRPHSNSEFPSHVHDTADGRTAVPLLFVTPQLAKQTFFFTFRREKRDICFALRPTLFPCYQLSFQSSPLFTFTHAASSPPIMAQSCNSSPLEETPTLSIPVILKKMSSGINSFKGRSLPDKFDQIYIEWIFELNGLLK